MINADIVYKIKLLGIGKYYVDKAWVTKVNVIPHTCGSGKTWTSKALVNKNFRHIKSLNGYGTSYTAEIVTFSLNELSNSDREI